MNTGIHGIPAGTRDFVHCVAKLSHTERYCSMVSSQGEETGAVMEKFPRQGGDLSLSP